MVELNDTAERSTNIMIIESRYHPDIADELVRGAIAQLDAAKASYKRYSVPSIFELPIAIRYAIRAVEIFPARRRYDGYIALGGVIREQPNRNNLLWKECLQSLQSLTLQFSLAFGLGVTVGDSHDDIWKQASSNGDDGGGEAVKTCLDMIRLKSDFKLFPRSA